MDAVIAGPTQHLCRLILTLTVAIEYRYILGTTGLLNETDLRRVEDLDILKAPMEYHDNRIIEHRVRRYRGISKTLALGIAAATLLLGFTLGLFVTTSSTGGLGGSPVLYEVV